MLEITHEKKILARRAQRVITKIRSNGGTEMTQTNTKFKGNIVDAIKDLVAQGGAYGGNVPGSRAFAFISDLYNHLHTRLSLEQFKSLLVDLNTQGQIVLSRCDLCAAYPQDKQKSSLTPYMNTTYHFVALPPTK